MTSVSASGGRSPVRLCRIVPQTNDPPAWLKAGRAFSFLAALTPRPLRRSIVTVRIPRPSSPLGFRSTGFGASVIVFPVIALQGRQIAFERLCGHPRTSRPSGWHPRPPEPPDAPQARRCPSRRHLFLARSAAPRWRDFAPPNHPTNHYRYRYRISDSHGRGRSTSPPCGHLSFVICHIIFRT